jgi:NDP-sugar pyrophosphorylase family protein
VQAANADVFAGLPDDQPTETVKMLYPQLIAQNPASIVTAYSDAEFLDVGTAQDYLSTVAAVAAREHRPFDVGDDCTIACDASVERSVLWNRVTVGAGARVINSVIADDVVIPDHAVVENEVRVR